ncbi:uncharacterized protein EKO05_0003971 [Ascochyta rabiei]|uniref:uncharacterized protein n=1 Tax=Didymella rabiei TaxID=5454 RepID=UPI0021F9F8E2|nr:uncharacterized protein EKO05_0003971 [Ascochyta rabiei]UPX13464.1 hypothetical protein EKO05_0003971 [Ascochyta rabiei]
MRPGPFRLAAYVLRQMQRIRSDEALPQLDARRNSLCMKPLRCSPVRYRAVCIGKNGRTLYKDDATRTCSLVECYDQGRVAQVHGRPMAGNGVEAGLQEVVRREHRRNRG